jgi:hypothetical protein
MFLPRPWRGTWGKAGAPIGPFFGFPSCQWMRCTQQMLVVPFMDACLINNGKLDIQITSPSDPVHQNGFTPTITAKSALLP